MNDILEELKEATEEKNMVLPPGPLTSSSLPEKIREFIAPESLIDLSKYTNKLFLAGSIEMGVAEKWQEKVIEEFNIRAWNKSTWAILNPRRKMFEEMKQSIDDDKFYRQVNWELEAIERANHVLFYFSPETKSPISLLEFGICTNFSGKQKIHVVCPDGFWRKGNIDIVCERYNINQHDTLTNAISAINYNNF